MVNCGLFLLTDNVITTLESEQPSFAAMAEDQVTLGTNKGLP